MIKVIGKHIEKCICKSCSSILEYEHDDIKQYQTGHDYLGEFDRVVGIKCPVCGTIIKV